MVPGAAARILPDGRYVVAKLDGSSAIVDVAGGGHVAKIDADDTRAAYWAAPDVVLVIGHGGAVAYSLQGIRIQSYAWPAWPARLGDDEPAGFTLIRRD